MNKQSYLLLFICLMGTDIRSKEWVLETADLEDFTTIASIASGNEGDIFAFSRSGGKIFKFTTDGKFIKSFGRLGEGPGEMKRVLFMFHNPFDDRLYLPEYHGRGRISIFNTGGTFEGYLELELTPKQKNRIWQFLFLKDGSFFVQLNERVDWQPVGKLFLTKDKLMLLHFDGSGKLLKEVFSTFENQEMSNRPGMGGPRILFSPNTLLRTTVQGNPIVIKTDDPQVRILGANGNKLENRALEIKKRPLSEEEFESTRDELVAYTKNPRMKMLAKNMVKLDYKPIFNSVYFSGPWTILASEKRGSLFDSVNSTALSFFSQEGKFEFSCEIPGQVLSITNGRVFYFEVDDEENEIYKARGCPVQNPDHLLSFFKKQSGQISANCQRAPKD